MAPPKGPESTSIERPEVKAVRKPSRFEQARLEWLSKQREDYANAKRETIEEARKTVRQKLEARDKSEKPEIDREKEFKEIRTKKRNQDNYLGTGGQKGWRDSYLEELDKDNKPVKDSMSIEEYVLQKQYQELDKIRNSLMEQRISGSIENIYPELKGEGNEDKRKTESKRITGLSQDFFQNPEYQKSIEQYLNSEVGSQEGIKTELLTKYQKEVFPDLKENADVASLFEELLADYQEMMVTKDFISKANVTMVANLANPDITDAEWDAALEKIVQEEEKALLDQQKKKEEVKVVSDSGAPSTITLNDTYFSTITAGEQLSSSTKIVIVPDPNFPGAYQVRFPAQSGENQFSRFRVEERPSNKEDKKPQKVFVYEDPLLDAGVEMSDENQFRKNINILYLNHQMSQSVREGRDYIGPELNSLIKDKEMYQLAVLLFKPKDLAKTPLEPDEAIAFRNLMLILINKNNNQISKEKPYGDLLAIQRRVRFINLALTIDNESRALPCFNILKNMSIDTARSTSVENLFQTEKIKVPGNNGRFS